MKKIISLILIICMVLSAVSIFAEDNAELVLREELFDRIEEICKDAGCTVFRNDVSIGVQKGTVGFAVMNDTVSYMENGMLVTESLYVDGAYVKMPQKAIDIVLSYNLPTKEDPDEKCVFNRYFKDFINTDYSYMRVINQSVEDEDCIVEIKEVLIGAEYTYITAKITAKNNAGRAIIPIWSDYSWMNFYGTTHGDLTTDLTYSANSVIDGDTRYLLYKIKSANTGTLKHVRVETIYNYIYEYLDFDIEDQKEELRVDFDGGYVLLKPLRVEYHLTEPDNTNAESADTPNILIKFKDGSECFVQEMCNKTASTTRTNGIVTEYVNCFKEELKLESVETVIVHGGK